jgi:hypothetical protein
MVGLEMRLLVAIAVLAAFLLVRRLGFGARWLRSRSFPWLLGVVGASVAVGFLYLSTRHLAFPLQLECMELTVLQHAQRMAAGLAIYPEPGPDFVALAYNPGYYFVLYPLLTILGPSLVVARLPAVMAAWALWVTFFVVARRATRDSRWALLLAALPFVASRSFDLYLTKGHGDSLMVLAIVLAALALDAGDGSGRVRRNLAAAVLLGCAFWFKQHAALVAIGGGLLMLARDRRASLPALGALALLGPAAYLLIAPALLGPDFLNSTFSVPSGWSSWRPDGVLRFVRYIADWWFVPAVVAAWAWWRALRSRVLAHDGVLFLLPFVLLTGLMGSLDVGSSDNVYLLSGVWLLLISVRKLGPCLRVPGRDRHEVVAVCAVLATFAMLVSDIREWLPDRGAVAAYREFVTYVEKLDGPLYAPWLGDFPFTTETSSRAHWVALEDRVRGPRPRPGAASFVTTVLAPVAGAEPPAYLLTIAPLEGDRVLGWLSGAYVLHEDVRERFAALHELPCRFGVRAPRYVYRRATVGDAHDE